jgi:hypothetical protein
MLLSDKMVFILEYCSKTLPVINGYPPSGSLPQNPIVVSSIFLLFSPSKSYDPRTGINNISCARPE